MLTWLWGWGRRYILVCCCSTAYSCHMHVLVPKTVQVLVAGPATVPRSVPARVGSKGPEAVTWAHACTCRRFAAGCHVLLHVLLHALLLVLLLVLLLLLLGSLWHRPILLPPAALL